MAFVGTDLAIVAQTGKAPRLFSYNTADTKATVVAANYFLSAFAVLQVGDLIMVRANNAAAGATGDIIMLAVLTCTSAGVTTVSKTTDA